MNSMTGRVRLVLIVGFLSSQLLVLAAGDVPSGSVSPDGLLDGYRELLGGFRQAADFEVEEAVDRPPDPDHILYSVQEILALAGRNSPGIRIAGQQAEAARADLQAARYRRFPTLDLESSASYLANPAEPVVLRSAELGEIGGMPLPPEDLELFRGMENSFYRMALIGKLPVYTWGKISRGIEAARLGLVASEEQYRQTRYQTRIELTAYLETLSVLKEALQVVDKLEAASGRLLEITGRSEQAGFLTASELAVARIRAQETRIARARLNEQQLRLYSRLARATGLEGLGPGDLDLPRLTARQPQWTQDQALALMRSHNRDLASLRALSDLRQSLYRVAQTKARGLPDIALRVELAYEGPRLPPFQEDWQSLNDYQLTVSLGTSGSLFGNAVRSGEAARARAEYQESISRYQDAEQGMAGFIREQYLNLELQRMRIEHAILSHQSWLEDLEREVLILAAGGGDEHRFLTSYIERLGELVDAWMLLAAYREALLTLEAAVGLD